MLGQQSWKAGASEDRLRFGVPVLISVVAMWQLASGNRPGDSDDVDQSFRSPADQIGAKRRWALSV